MMTIQEALIESVANLGIGESLLVFTSDAQFFRFDATANGLITMSADNGSTQMTMSRDLISQAIIDFNLASRIDELPLKTILLTSSGSLEVDTEEPQVLGADLEGIPNRFDVPLIERIKQVLVQQVPMFRGFTSSSLNTEDNAITLDAIDNFTLEIKHNGDESLIRLQAYSENVLAKVAQDYAAMQIELDDFNLVKVQAMTGGPFTNNECVLVFEVVIPSIPFVGQHFTDALSSLSTQIKDWDKFHKEVSS